MTDNKEITINNINDNIKNNNDVWESCCLRTNRHAVTYISQVIISIIVIIISTSMIIISSGECNRSSPWIGLVSFVLGKVLSTVHN
jgi:hypothetical protein